jgi:hypothetical protein
MADDNFTAIDPETLDDVTGGVATATSNNAQVTAALQSVTSSLAALQNQNSQSSFSQLMPLLALGGLGGGKCPCGCGSGNCIRR